MLRSILFVASLALLLWQTPAAAADKTIGVFVALADNKSQGLVPVPARIGNGNDPENNLYWGNSEGLQGTFDHSRRWKLIGKQSSAAGDILRTRTYRHVQTGAVLTANAYRGSSMRRCIADYDSAVANASYDLVVFIGHNGLMDFTLPTAVRPPKRVRRADCAVLCCKSDSFFRERLIAEGGRPILLTTQLMYPGAFIVTAIAESWMSGGRLDAIRERAGAAYAANQKISRRAGTGVFAKLRD